MSQIIIILCSGEAERIDISKLADLEMPNFPAFTLPSMPSFEDLENIRNCKPGEICVIEQPQEKNWLKNNLKFRRKR